MERSLYTILTVSINDGGGGGMQKKFALKNFFGEMWLCQNIF